MHNQLSCEKIFTAISYHGFPKFILKYHQWNGHYIISSFQMEHQGFSLQLLVYLKQLDKD